jgi:glycosyltransferase involved in cell wall biosynthesis
LLSGWGQFVGRRDHREATLLLVGEGPEQGCLEGYCCDHGLDNVRFAGPVDYDDIAVYYRCADAFIIPTLEDNWSLVVPEAMACGLPILCSRYNGCWPEFVTEENGWTFDPLSAEDIARVLTQAMAAKGRWTEMGRRSTAIVSAYTPRWAAGVIHEGCLLAHTLRKGPSSPAILVGDRISSAGKHAANGIS